jgi:hypothetical protein
MTHAIIPLSIPAPAITAHAENIENNRTLISQPVSNHSNPYPHLFPYNNIPDNTFIAHSLPNNSQTFTSLSYSPIITESLPSTPLINSHSMLTPSQFLNQRLTPLLEPVKKTRPLTTLEPDISLPEPTPNLTHPNTCLT